MKHTFRTIVVAAMAMLTLAFVGCSKEENNNDSNDDIVLGTAPAVWVDLGLPSGLLWATCNVGATTPEGYGDYFAWGETTTKDRYTWSTYIYCTVNGEGNLDTLTKYNTSPNYGTVDNLTTLQHSDDAATVRMGNGARIPTKEDWEELISRTSVEWKPLNGVSGIYLTSTINGKSIFLPAAGEIINTENNNAGIFGSYWSASLLTNNGPRESWAFSFSDDYNSIYYDYRSDGRSVRAVRAR